MAVRVVMPSFGMYTAEGTIAGWLAAPGSEVEVGAPLVDVTTEKANYEIESPAAGRFHPVVEIGAVLQVEGLIALVLEAGESADEALAAAGVAAAERGAAAESTAPAAPPGAPSAPSAPSGHRAPTSESSASPERSRVSPLARRLAVELGVELATVAGSGPGGRIVEGDIRAAAARTAETAAPRPAAAASAATAAVHAVPWRVRERLPLTGDRRTIGERLRRSQSTAVALTLTREVHAGALVAARRTLADRIGAALPWDALFVRLFGAALRERGELNALIAGEEIVRLDEVHVAFAVSLEGSLVTPVIRDADRRPLAAIAADVRELGARARAGKLTLADLLGATATITNLGAHGVDAFTPVLNPPQSAILGIGRIAERAVVVDGALAVAPTCVLSLTFDHRVADGAPAADLLAAVARRMADAAWLAALD